VDGPPTFKPKIKEGELPPDAVYVVGFLPLVTQFYKDAKIHELWAKHRLDYNDLVEHYTTAVGKMVFDTDIYLKLALSGYLGRDFIVYLEPLGLAGQANARNYADNYYVVLTPTGDTLQVEQIRHTYLHYVLDPMALKRFGTIEKLAPLLDVVKTSPMDEISRIVRLNDSLAAANIILDRPSATSSPHPTAAPAFQSCQTASAPSDPARNASMYAGSVPLAECPQSASAPHSSCPA